MFELHKDEKIIMYIRKHWIFLFLETKIIFALFIIPVIVVWILQWYSIFPNVILFGISLTNLFDIFIYMWAIVCWLFLAEKFTDYALDFWILTNKRIVESELVSLFNRKLSTLELEDIEDITIQNKGFLATVIDYGSLEVQTAGADKEFLAEKILNPAKVQTAIFEAKLAQKKEEQDVERGEMEQVSHRVHGEELAAVYRQKDNNSNVDREVDKNLALKYNESLDNNNSDNPSVFNNAHHINKIKDIFKSNQTFDWAHINERQKADERNVTEYVEKVEDKCMSNSTQALRTE